MDFILIEKKGHIAILTINREDALNALNTTVLKEFGEAFETIQKDDDVRSIIITGAGRAFVAGADIAEMANFTMMEGRAFGNVGQELFRRIERSEKPVIAAINGFALGAGMELALACDIRIASEHASFAQPEVGLGIIPGFSGTQRLAAAVGKSVAAELILTGDRIDAGKALEIGLISKLTSAEDLLSEAEAMAKKIAANAPLAVRWANSALKRGREVDIDSGIAIEADLFGMCFTTKDQKEGMKAFLERRKAKFKGK